MDEVGALARVSWGWADSGVEEGTGYQTWKVPCKYSENFRKTCDELVDDFSEAVD